MLASLWDNRQLVTTLARRDIVGRYRGSLFGVGWSLLNPILMLAVYTFVFGFIMRARWASGDESKAEFALVLFAGLLVYNLFAECINRAPGLILSNVNYVKKVVFPIEILPWVTLLSALFHLLMSLGVWFLFRFLLMGLPHPTALLLPFILLPLIALIMGACWWLASLGVYLRDVGQVVGTLSTLLLFLSPVFYPLSALPPSVRPMLALNPLSQVIEQTREALIWGRAPDLVALMASTLAASVFAWLGFAWFQKTRKGFADVL